MDSDYAFLKEHDPEWLSKTLRDHVNFLREWDKPKEPEPEEAGTSGSASGGHHEDQQDSHTPHRTNASKTSQGLGSSLLAGPHDITAPELHLHSDHGPLSKHIELIRRYDWAATGLGPMETWHIELRRMVNMCMSDIKPTMLWWGPQRLAIYNEAYAGIIASKHPAALGKNVHGVWPELTASNHFEDAFALGDRTGETSCNHREMFIVKRHDYWEEAYASWSIIPIPGPHGNLGFYNTLIDATPDVLNDRRMNLLHRLEQCLSAAETTKDFWKQVLTGLETDSYEVPFAALYGPAIRGGRSLLSHEVVDEDDTASSAPSERTSIFSETEWTLKGIIAEDVGPDSGSNSLPGTIDLDRGSSVLSPLFHDCMVSKMTTILRADNGTLSGSLISAARPRTFQGQPLTHAVLLPIWTTYQEHRSGFLLLGLNSRRRYDSDYQRFTRLLHNQLTTTLATLAMGEDEARRNRVAARLAARDRIRLVEQLAETRHEVKQSELRFRSMADFAPIGIFELNANGKLQYANEQWIELTNCSLDRLHDFETFTSALVEDDRPLAWRKWARLQAGEQVRFECRLDRPFVTDETFNGERMVGDTWILVAAYALRDDLTGPSGDEVKGVFGCLVDISRQKWIEGFQERQARVQQERRRQQENFMDSTNHEARNPLAAITLCAEDMHTTIETLLHQSQAPQLPVERETALAILESAEIIMSCAKHQKSIIDDVLTLSKLDSNMLSVSPEPVIPTRALDQALKMFRGEMRRNDVDLVYTVDPSYSACNIDWVLLDATRFLQILVNLLNNALKFTQTAVSRKIAVSLGASTSPPTGQDLRVRFAPLADHNTPPTSPSGDGVYLSVTVTDTGQGMSNSELEGLFEKFRQASPKTYAQYGGSGLGLWICKELCTRLGGQIGVASNSASTSDDEKSGSTFAFYVHAVRCNPPPQATERAGDDVHNDGDVTQGSRLEPTAELKAVDSKTENAPSSNKSDSIAPETVSSETPTKKSHILIVEDNLVNQRVMQRQLTRAGFHISVANHGREALDILYPPTTAPETISTILMDFEMPIMGGLECTRLIREKEATRPIIGVTANARVEQQKAAIEAGMNCVITKPFQMGQLLEAIKNVS